jgi:poly-gamma-glutamate synthesis protein (capsule biosynthesis protein)
MVVQIALCGDVMLGRGIDQVLSHPGDPSLTESYVRDARQYVELAEAVAGQVPVPVGDDWPWGDALAELHRSTLRVVNLETSVTRCGTFAPGKAVHYRMEPDNVGALSVARPDVCVLANNHVLDFGGRGLEETLETLARAGLTVAGAGHDVAQATAPALVRTSDQPPVSVLAFGHGSSGVPPDWSAAADRPGVALLPDLSEQTAAQLGDRIRQEKKRQGAIVVVSLHWGSNWGYEVPREQVLFARRLVDAGADIVHGHSSHHPRPIEVYAGRLVLYGCGDFINDYEGIRGHAEYRPDLRLLYEVSVDTDGAVLAVDLVPFQSMRLRLERAGDQDVAWLFRALDRVSRPHGSRVRPTAAGSMEVTWR